MAVTTDPFVAADLAARIPEVWTPLVQEELFAAMCGANFFTDLSGYAAQGGDIFHVADVYTNTFSVKTQTTQGEEITTAGPAQVDVTLTVNLHKYIAYIIGDKDYQQLMSNFDYSGVYARKSGKILATALEASIFGLWSGLTGNTAVGDTTTVLTDLEIRTAIATLDANHFNTMECAFFFHPTVYWKQVAGIQKYYDASMRGQAVPGFTLSGNFGAMDASRGLKGDLYGSPIYVSTNVVSGLQTYRNLYASKEAFGFAIQTPGGNKVRVQAENAIRNLGLLTVSDIIYGVAELRDKAAVVVNANMTATTS